MLMANFNNDFSISKGVNQRRPGSRFCREEERGCSMARFPPRWLVLNGQMHCLAPRDRTFGDIRQNSRRQEGNSGVGLKILKVDIS